MENKDDIDFILEKIPISSNCSKFINELGDESAILFKEAGIKPTGQKGGYPSGRQTKIPNKADSETRRSLMRENDSAEAVVNAGYITEQNLSTQMIKKILIISLKIIMQTVIHPLKKKGQKYLV